MAELQVFYKSTHAESETDKRVESSKRKLGDSYSPQSFQYNVCQVFSPNRGRENKGGSEMQNKETVALLSNYETLHKDLDSSLCLMLHCSFHR